MYYINPALEFVSLTKFLHMLKSECSIYFGLDIICVVFWQWDNRKRDVDLLFVTSRNKSKMKKGGK